MRRNCRRPAVTETERWSLSAALQQPAAAAPRGAEPYYERALGLTRAHLGPIHPAHIDITVNLGDAKLRLGLAAEASEPLQRALALYERVQGESSPEIVATLRLLGEAALAQGRRDEAVAHLRRAAALALADFDADHPDLARRRRPGPGFRPTARGGGPVVHTRASAASSCLPSFLSVM